MDRHAALVFAVWLLLQLLNTPLTLYLNPPDEDDEEAQEALRSLVDGVGEPMVDPHSTMCTVVENFRLCTSFNLFSDDLGYWVKLRSTTWFSHFLLSEYDDRRWIQIFQMTKHAIFVLADLLAPHVQKKDTKYRLAIPVVVRIAYCLFKLT